MSWNVRVASAKQKDFLDHLEDAQPPFDLSEHQTDQLRHAKDATKALVESGILGGEEAIVFANLSGHAHGEKPGPGDTLNVALGIGTEVES